LKENIIKLWNNGKKENFIDLATQDRGKNKKLARKDRRELLLLS